MKVVDNYRADRRLDKIVIMDLTGNFSDSLGLFAQKWKGVLMVEIIRNTLPWFGKKGRAQATTSEATAGGHEHSTRWVTLGVNFNPGEALVIKGRLESEGIPVVVQQEAFGSFIGLTVGPLGSAKVLVPEPLAERARSILAETFEGTEAGDEDWDDTLAADVEG